MNTQDMRDDALDAMFINASDSAEFAFEERNWDVLEKRMDYVTMLTRMKRITILEGVAIIIGIVMLITFSGVPAGNELADRKGVVSAESQYDAKTINPAAVDAGSESATSVPDSGKKPYISPQVIRNNPEVVSDVENLTEVQSNQAIGYSDSEPDPERMKEIREVPARDFNYTITSPEIPDIDQTAIILEPVKPAARASFSRLSVNLTLGPDLSGVRIKGLGAGTYTGLVFEYNITRSLSFMTGVNLVSKKYGVSEGEYSIPDSSFIYYGRVPENINISCQVIDIPFNIYFNVLNWQKSKLSLGTGLSSYLMLSEEYQYVYGRNNVNSRTITLRNENQHYFGIMNLSVAYTARFGNRWAWQIEPYYKLPVTDIAAAKVRLHSAGVFVTLKYILK